MSNVEIIFNESKNEKYMLEFTDINGKHVGVCLMTAGHVEIDNVTNELFISGRDDLPSFTVKNKVYVHLDLLLFGRVYEVSVFNSGDSTFINCIMK